MSRPVLVAGWVELTCRPARTINKPPPTAAPLPRRPKRAIWEARGHVYALRNPGIRQHVRASGVDRGKRTIPPGAGGFAGWPAARPGLSAAQSRRSRAHVADRRYTVHRNGCAADDDSDPTS